MKFVIRHPAFPPTASAREWLVDLSRAQRGGAGPRKAHPVSAQGLRRKPGVIVHGTDLQSSAEFTDETKKTHGDVFTVAMSQ